MTPHAVYVSPTAVYVQWHSRGPFVVLHEDGTITEQFRLPPTIARVAIGRTLIDQRPS
jgi:hypothetical protein